MPLNNSRQSIIANRKSAVARLRLMGFSQREIANELEKEKIINPETNKPFALGTINSDLQELEAEWRKQATEDTRSQRGRVLAESRELRHRAWAKDDLPLVMRALAQETNILGLQRPAAPQDIIHYDTRYVPIESEMSKHIGKMITVGNAPNVTPEEKATLKKLFEEWHQCASTLLERNGQVLEPLAEMDMQDQQDELESPLEEDAQDEDD